MRRHDTGDVSVRLGDFELGLGPDDRVHGTRKRGNSYSHLVAADGKLHQTGELPLSPPWLN